MKRRYKFLVLLVAWGLAALFVVPQSGGLMPISGRPQIFGVLEALLFLACAHGSLIWLVWPAKARTLPRKAIP